MGLSLKQAEETDQEDWQDYQSSTSVDDTEES
jgi:hypothetical protein